MCDKQGKCPWLTASASQKKDFAPRDDQEARKKGRLEGGFFKAKLLHRALDNTTGI